MKNILITGLNGYIARHLVQALLTQVETLHASVRQNGLKHSKITIFETGDLANPTDWTAALKNIDTVFHLAGTVHTENSRDVYERVIVTGTRNLVEQAIQHGVKHFIYLSSAAVYGKENHSEKLCETDILRPNTPYGEAKRAAEQALISLSKPAEMTYTIVRPPIVTGFNAPGNVAKLKKLIQTVPVLPFGTATARRSMVSVNTLVDFLVTCGTHPNARNQIFNITDPEAISTRELCQQLARECERKILLLSIPKLFMRLGFSILGQKSMYEKLFGTFQLSIQHARECLDWNVVK